MATYTVTTDQDVVDATDGVVSLREAIAAANGNGNAGTQDVISFAGGITNLVLTGGELTITEDVIIDGSGQTIDTNGNSRVLRIDGPTTGADIVVGLDELTLTGGSVAGFGGGIEADNTELTITASTISGNSTSGVGSGGGGLFALSSTVAMTNSTISGNSTGDNVGRGGGLLVDNTELIITASTISGNSTTGPDSDGGGIFASFSMVEVTNSTISGNSTTGDFSDGGGLYTTNSTVAVTNSTISGNSTSGSGSDGGGLYARDSTVELTNSILVGNQAEQSPATNDISASLAATSTNNLFGQASVAGGAGQNAVTGVAAAEVFAAVDPVTGGGLLAFNGGPTQTIALLDDPANPALDSAVDAGLTTDQRSEPRDDGAPDIGAFELQAANTPPVAADDAATTDEDMAVIIDVLANDGDADGDALSVVDVSSPNNGVVIIEADGTLTYQPFPDVNGADSFIYTIDDGNGGMDSAEVDITIDPVQDPPRLRGEGIAIVTEDMGGPFSFDVVDPDGDPLSFLVDGNVLPVGGTADLASGALLIHGPFGEFFYDPNGAFESLNDGDQEIDSIDFAVTDGIDVVALPFNVTIEGVDDAIVCAPIVGDDGDNILTGADECADDIRGLNGKDTILGLGMDDVIDGGGGADRIEGNKGDDTLDGGNQGDSIAGGAGNDSINGGNGADTIVGGRGDDMILAGRGDDTLTGGVKSGLTNDINLFDLGQTDDDRGLAGNDVITDFDVNSTGNEFSFDTLAFNFAGQDFAVSTKDEFLDLIEFLDTDGDASSEALIDGVDLVLAFVRDGATGPLVNSVRLENVVGRDGLTIGALEANGADPFLIA